MECLPSTLNHQGPVKSVSPTYSTSTPIIVEDVTSEYTTPTYIYDNAEELFHTDMTYCKPPPEPPPKPRTFDHVNDSPPSDKQHDPKITTTATNDPYSVLEDVYSHHWNHRYQYDTSILSNDLFQYDLPLGL